MRFPIILLLSLATLQFGCRDREEVALKKLDDTGYGFSVSDYQAAAAAGDIEAVNGFLQAGMAVDVEGPDGETAFLNAAANGQDAMVKHLIQAGARPDQRLADGRTMLMNASADSSGDVRLIDFLLEHHADAKAVDASGMTSLMVAAMAGNVEGIRRLAPLDVRSLDKALMLAAARGHTHCLEALIERGAYVNCRSHDSQTPLMYAAGKGHLEATQLLLRHFANRFAVDESGQSAADLAESEGYAALTALLRDTSDLARPVIPANDEFLPTLDGQLIAFLEEPTGAENLLPGAIEPRRPALAERPESASGGGDSADPAQGGVALSPQLGAAGFDLAAAFQLGQFKERFEPLLVTEVTPKAAKIRVLHRPEDAAAVTVMVGQRIPGTAYEVTKLTKRLRPAKGGGTVDVSEVRVRDTARDREQRFVRGTLPRDQDTHLVVETKHSQKQFAAHPGDVFTVAETGEKFTVTEVRPHQLLLRNVVTSEILTIQRR